jgi:hypothetical protein
MCAFHTNFILQQKEAALFNSTIFVQEESQICDNHTPSKIEQEI